MQPKRVREALVRTAEGDAADKIIVRNLEVVVNAGVDVWGRQKKQRALITVTLNLIQSFDTAATTDSLDGSTIHYGKLSKDIQAAVQAEPNWIPTERLAYQLTNRVFEMAGLTKIMSLEVDIFYPKGSMFGDGAGLRCTLAHIPGHVDDVSTVLYLRNLRIPCIIGVNSNERLQKQPVVVNISIECVETDRIDEYPKLETAVFKAISDSSFETLESLSTMVVQKLKQEFFTEKDAESYVRLRVGKPLAVPFADAPVIEIFRPVRP